MRHIPELDGLRAVAVTAVVLLHTLPLFRGGFLGVDLFFVLSGFLISTILIEDARRDGRIDLRRFYWRRARRLMPALLLMLGVYLCIAPFIWPGEPHSRDALLSLFYVTDYSFTFWRVPLHLQHTWSLGVEEKFYLLWPLLLPILLKSKRPEIWLLAAYVVATLWRGTFDDARLYYFRFDTRLSGLILGALTAFAVPRVNRWIAYGAAFVFYGLLLVATSDVASTYIPLAELSAAILIVGATTGSLGVVGDLLRTAPFVWIGQISYGIYLWHYPIAELARSVPHHMAFPITFCCSVALAAVSHYTVESWALRARAGAVRVGAVALR